MKKGLKILGLTLSGLVALLAIVLLYIQWKGVPRYEYRPTAEIAGLRVGKDSALIARGAAIGTMHCVACHAAEDGKLSGRPINDLPPEFGRLYSLNITHDTTHGIGAWTDGELYYFLRTGIRKDGSWAPPFMPKFPLMADEDLRSVIAWLRSDDPRLKASPREYPANEYNLFLKILGNVAFGPPPMPEKPIYVPDSTDQIAFGRYVANDLANCFVCHSSDITQTNPIEPEKSPGFYGGGYVMRNEAGEKITTANITMDPETGIGKWTESQFVDAVRFGKNPRGGTLSYPMMPHTTLTETEVKAIFAYLKTVPVIQTRP